MPRCAAQAGVYDAFGPREREQAKRMNMRWNDRGPSSNHRCEVWGNQKRRLAKHVQIVGAELPPNR